MRITTLDINEKNCWRRLMSVVAYRVFLRLTHKQGLEIGL